MPEAATTFDVRELSEGARAIDIQGDITAQSEDVLMDAYAARAGRACKAIVLNFSRPRLHEQWRHRAARHAAHRAQRQHQRVLAYGLSDHYRQIFELTRLNEAVGIHDSEADALADAGAS